MVGIVHSLSVRGWRRRISLDEPRIVRKSFVYVTVRLLSHSCALPSRAVLRVGNRWAVSAFVGIFPNVIEPDAVECSLVPSGRKMLMG